MSQAAKQKVSELLPWLSDAFMYSRVVCVSQPPINGACNDSLQALQQACVQVDLLCLVREQPHILQQVLHTRTHHTVCITVRGHRNDML